MKPLLILIMLLTCKLSYTQIGQKSDTLNPVVLSTLYVWEPHPCPIDTIKGILFWHSKTSGNNGNAWDTGYWVGPCGAMGIYAKNITLVPGQLKITQVMQVLSNKKYGRYETVHEFGKFYDYRWRHVASKDVYALIIIRDAEPTPIYEPPLLENLMATPTSDSQTIFPSVLIPKKRGF